MNKIKVGFLLNLSYSWMGEVNYIKSLLISIKKFESHSIHPIIFFPENIDGKLRKEFEILAEVILALTDIRLFIQAFVVVDCEDVE